MDSFQTFIILMFAAAILIGISQKIRIPYPIGLVLGGVILGFTPIKNMVYFNPNLILIIVLPPVLYYAAFGISFREFKTNLHQILSLALALVVFNTFMIGMLFHWIFPQLPYALAFAFGAIISPPDAIAATAILKRFAINSRLLAILEGESLINDASALVLYKMAVVALLSGFFSVWEGSVAFTYIVCGGIVVGLITGYLLQNFARLFLQPIVGIVFSFTIPYVTYSLANYLGVSGVLAVVINGLMGSKILTKHHSSVRRIFGYVTWDIFIIFMNCFVFTLIGLQLHTLTLSMSINQMIFYSGYALLITFAMILIRMAWVYTSALFIYYKEAKDRRSRISIDALMRETALIGWAGMRGIVSLTAALALPYTYPNGLLLEGRNELIFIVFVVLLLTLLIPGLTLELFIRLLKIEKVPDPLIAFQAKRKLIQVAKQTIAKLYFYKEINHKEQDFLKAHFNLNSRLLEHIQTDKIKLKGLETAKNLVIKEQRKKLIHMWENYEIDDELLTELEQELDLEENNIARAELT